MKNNNIDIHADDYALTLQTSKEMLSLMRQGVLDSISIIPNTSCYEDCMELLKGSVAALPFLPMMSVHLNIVEGLCLSAKKGRTLIATNWKRLFLGSYLPGQKQVLKNQLKEELTIQVNKVWASVQECMSIAEQNHIPCKQRGLRIDSHQHTHLIPVVWEALQEVLAEQKYPVEYIRNSREPLLPFLTGGLRYQLGGKPLLFSYRFVNLLKNRILFLYSGKLDRMDDRSGRRKMLLWGLLMSGKMDEERVKKLLEPMADYARRKGRTLEILFHPGRMAKEEASDETAMEAAESFYLSSNRNLEYQAALLLRSVLKETEGTY